MDHYLDHSNHHAPQTGPQSSIRSKWHQSTPAICLSPTVQPLCQSSVLYKLGSWHHCWVHSTHYVQEIGHQCTWERQQTKDLMGFFTSTSKILISQDSQNNISKHLFLLNSTKRISPVVGIVFCFFFYLKRSQTPDQIIGMFWKCWFLRRVVHFEKFWKQP